VAFYVGHRVAIIVCEPDIHTGMALTMANAELCYAHSFSHFIGYDGFSSSPYGLTPSRSIPVLLLNLSMPTIPFTPTLVGDVSLPSCTDWQAYSNSTDRIWLSRLQNHPFLHRGLSTSHAVLCSTNAIWLGQGSGVGKATIRQDAEKAKAVYELVSIIENTLLQCIW
jgi:hypothetical protein